MDGRVTTAESIVGAARTLVREAHGVSDGWVLVPLRRVEELRDALMQELGLSLQEWGALCARHDRRDDVAAVIARQPNMAPPAPRWLDRRTETEYTVDDAPIGAAVALDSDWLLAAAWRPYPDTSPDPEHGSPLLELHMDRQGNRRVYGYLGVPLETFVGLLNAPSPGTYYNTDIKDRYTCVRLA